MSHPSTTTPRRPARTTIHPTITSISDDIGLATLDAAFRSRTSSQMDAEELVAAERWGGRDYRNCRRGALPGVRHASSLYLYTVHLVLSLGK